MNDTSQFKRMQPIRRVNPRRRAAAVELISYTWHHGGKVFLDDHTYSAMAERGIARWAVDAAADDLFARGDVDLRPAGDTYIVDLRVTGGAL